MVTPFRLCYCYLSWSFRCNPVKSIMKSIQSNWWLKTPLKSFIQNKKHNMALTRSKWNSYSNTDMVFIFSTKFNVGLVWNVLQYALLVMNKETIYDRVPNGICHYKWLKSILKYYKYPKELWLLSPTETFYNIRAS